MDRIKLIIWSIIFIIFINSSLAAEISGTVRDEDSQPSPGVAIMIEGTDIGTVTDYEGKFLLRNIDPGEYTLKFTSFSTEIKIIANTNEEVDLSFTPRVTLPEIVVEAKRPKLQPIIRLSTPISELYGNCLVCLSSSLPIKQGEPLNIKGYESVYDDGEISESISPEFMKWYVGIPKEEFDEILRSDNQWLIFDIETLLLRHKSEHPELFVMGVDQFDLRLDSNILSTGRYYVVLKIVNPYDSSKEGITWHQFNLYPTDATDEELARVDQELLREQDLSRQQLFSPSEFLTCDQPQPSEKVCHNGYWVPPLVSSWSCQETDFPLTNPAYDNPTISSSCRTGEIIQRDTCGCLDQDGIFTTDCLQGFTHVAEYSCSNYCRERTIKTCPEGTQCIIGRDGGACKSPNFEDLEEIQRLELGLLELPLQSQEESITIELTDNDLINSALCSSLNIDVSSLEVVETQPLTGTPFVIKQITGFFSKITGKQTSIPLRTYTTTIDSSGYSELANLEFPYYIFPDNSKARFLDRNVGSALLKDFGYTPQIVEAAISSSQPSYRTGDSGLTLLKLGNSYIFPSTNIITDILYGGTLSASRARAIENLGSESNIISALETLFSTRNPNNYAGLRFLLIRTTGNKFLKIGDNIFSVSRGLYLIPYPFNNNINYESISDPTQESDLKPYYDLPFNIPAASYVIGSDKYVNVKFLTPSEGYYALRDLPITPTLETIERSFTYTHKEGGRALYAEDLNYRIIPIGNLPSNKDYGDFQKGLYFVPEKNIIVMDNEYEASKHLRRKPGAKLEVPAANAKLAYEFGFFDLVRESLRAREREAYRNSLKGWFMEHAVDPVVEPFKEPRLRNAKVFT